MRPCDPFGHFQPAKVPVVIVQAAELQSETGNRARQLDNHVAVSLLDAGAIHAGIDVEENSHSAAAPLPHTLQLSLCGALFAAVPRAHHGWQRSGPHARNADRNRLHRLQNGEIRQEQTARHKEKRGAPKKVEGSFSSPWRIPTDL